MTEFIINGDFFCNTLTGIERFAYEICLELDNIAQPEHIGIFIPHNARTIPQYKNISVYISEKTLTSYPRWQQFVYGPFLRSKQATGIDFSNSCALLRPGIVFLHDIYCKLYPKDFSGFRNILSRLYFCMMYHFVAKHARILITVSQFSRSQIAHTYHIDEDKIQIIYSAWDHFRRIQSDESVFNDFPALKRGNFYFTLGSLSKRKNLKWIAAYAAAHPADCFAVSGALLASDAPSELEPLYSLSNIHLLGYLCDEKVKALMRACKAFIFPSYYEGFGLPPLEALSCGAAVIIAKAASLPEIYGNAAHYIDPDNADTDLDRLLSEPVEPACSLLSRYTYRSSAQALYSLLYPAEQPTQTL